MNSWLEKRNNICTTIFIQLLYNFLSHTHIIFLFSLPFFFSLFVFDQWEERTKGCLKSCTKKVVQISLLIRKRNNNIIMYTLVTQKKNHVYNEWFLFTYNYVLFFDKIIIMYINKLFNISIPLTYTYIHIK